ncbi:NAD(P)-dependent oxidoreductase [Lewinellaceae bacterium SD302]|nr:NAD(P)-dependent oxidoreductase [Lewinellaceae bacterium SD302]
MTEHEAGALSALKDNIAQLEALLQEREAAAREAEQNAAQALLEARVGHGKIALISGATSGIGLATARQLAEDGYRLILTGRRGDRLEKIATELREEHESDVLTLTFDVRDAGATQSAIDGLSKEWAAIDVLINNAGKAKGLSPIHEGSLDHWNEMIDVNLKGLLYLTRAVTPGMVKRKSGFVINICSTAGKEVYPQGNVYCATKHAVDALTAAMRMDLVEHGVRVGQICPAHVEETEFAEVRFDGDKKRASKVYKDFQPLISSDVAEAVAFILNRPAHVNVLDLVLQGKQQASSTMIDRSGRE